MSYDAMGRVVAIWACGPATCGTGSQASRPLSFAYDWAGNLIQESDSVSGTINYGRSIAGEVTSITNATYQNAPQNPPSLVSNVVNGPNGPVSYTLGNGLNVYRTYDTLGRYVGQWVCSGPAAAGCAGGAQIYGTVSGWVGSQLRNQADTVLNQQVSYSYGDGFNRLTARTVTSGTVQNYTYSYDRYGNRVSQTALQGGYNFNPTINPANNQITTSGYTYDAAGNMTNDTVHSYTYDAEGNITKVDGGSSAQYVYDVFNRRIHVQVPSGTTEYIYDYAGRRISSWVSPNNTGNEGRIHWDGQLIAHRSLEALTYFDHQDTLGTDRIRTNYGGWVAATYLSLPWGDGYSATVSNAGADQDNEHFAGMERDAESETEHAQFRNYASAQGRWLSPDPYIGSYDLTNPQSMNRYTYVLDNPLSLFDPLGLELVEIGEGCYQSITTYSVSAGGTTDGGVDVGGIVCLGGTQPGCVSSGTQGCIQPQSPINVPVASLPSPSTASNAPNNAGQKPKVNWFANSNCQSAFLNSKYGPGTTSFVSHFSLLSWTPLASGPSANSSDTIAPTIATEGAKVGVGYLLKFGGAGSQTLSAWGAMTLIPGLLGTAWDAEAKNACKDVTGTNPQGW